MKPTRPRRKRSSAGSRDGRSPSNEEGRLDSWCRQNLDGLAELEAEAPLLAEGNTLLHFDIRADNLLIAGDRVYLVDWPWARLGPAWIDWVGMAPSVAMQGGPEPEDFLRRFDLSHVSRRAVDAVICALAGYFVVRALEPAPPTPADRARVSGGAGSRCRELASGTDRLERLTPTRRLLVLRTFLPYLLGVSALGFSEPQGGL